MGRKWVHFIYAKIWATSCLRMCLSKTRRETRQGSNQPGVGSIRINSAEPWRNVPGEQWQQDQMVTGAHWREDPEHGALRKKETLDYAKHAEAFGNHVVMLMPEKQQEIRKAIRDTRQNKMKQNYKERKCSHDAFLCFAEDVFIVS